MKVNYLSSGGMGYQELELQTPITTAFLENKQLLHKNLPYDRATINKSWNCYNNLQTSKSEPGTKGMIQWHALDELQTSFL